MYILFITVGLPYIGPTSSKQWLSESKLFIGEDLKIGK